MSKSNRRRRVTNGNANRRLPPSSEAYVLSPYDADRQMRFDFEGALRALEDRRTWHPEGPQRPARSLRGSQHRFVVASDPSPKRRVSSSRVEFFSPSVPVGVGFEKPREVALCVRRQQRREVLHARRKTGKRGQKKPVWSYYSRVRCK